MAVALLSGGCILIGHTGDLYPHRDALPFPTATRKKCVVNPRRTCARTLQPRRPRSCASHLSQSCAAAGAAPPQPATLPDHSSRTTIA
eukprot:scaffold34643_cov62-Phaeocystis_antarctica.AAC.21